MKDVIKRIIGNEDLGSIYEYAIGEIFSQGPVSGTPLEILSYLKMYAPDFIKINEPEILHFMGVFYKSPHVRNIRTAVFDIYSKQIIDRFGESYTPIQANIYGKILSNKNFSFSAPTSTGKSHIFRSIIRNSNGNIAIIVPSRALINEYYLTIKKLLPEKTTNILTFVDLINTKHARRSVFVLTPERARELFKFKSELEIDLFLFDEAQLSDEQSTRALYFDSIVRRVQKAYQRSKCVFVYLFVSNPESQLTKNAFDVTESASSCYEQKNVGQMYFAHSDNGFFHFGLNKELMGARRVISAFDPIRKSLDNGRSILVYTTKSSIYDRSVFQKFQTYIDLCEHIADEYALALIERLREFIGSDTEYHSSFTLSMMEMGIVIHHGSLPLQARMIIEEFTQKNYSRICFATSTLEQGINMPFDVVYLNSFPASKPLSIKNLIGRAGRSTNEAVFDFGIVIIRSADMSSFRKIMSTDVVLSDVSALDQDTSAEDEIYNEFKEAIKKDEFSDVFNLTNKDLAKLSSDEIEETIRIALNGLFIDGQLLAEASLGPGTGSVDGIIEPLSLLYRTYLNGRELSDGEKSVLTTALKIVLWKVHKRTFKEICWLRYSYVARIREQRECKTKIKNAQSESEALVSREILNKMTAKFLRGYDDLPDSELRNYSLYPIGAKAIDIDYDRIVFDTYDYLDKLIGFKLSDIYYAAFFKFYEKTNDDRALRMAKYFKFGTDDDTEILMLRYGIPFEEMSIIREHLISISEEEIVFNETIKTIPLEKIASIERYIL